MNSKNLQLGYLVLRFATGLNFAMHGLGRMGPRFEAFHTWITGLFANTGFPMVLVEAMSYVIPAVEASLGIALLIGWKTKNVLLGIAILLLSLLFGQTFLQKWDLVAILMLYFCVLFLLLALLDANHYSLDRKLAEKN